jgi:patatin-like phospholipase/acyl hydrolase
MKRRRILSIDGGGIKGVFPISFLAHLEAALSLQSVANYFDLIAGTSVGGIIALGLGLGQTAQQMRDFFVEKGPDIFPQHAVPASTFRLLCGAERYRPDHLRAALTEVFGSQVLGDSRVRLLIPAFDATKADIHIYKTAHHERLGIDHRLTAVEVALATAAAPTFFPAYDSSHCITLVDGGIWANDPVALAAVEGVSVLQWDADEIDVLSIGCTEETIDFKQRGHGGIFWIRRAIEAAMRGQSRSALGMARHLTGRDKGLENVVRINPVVAANRFSLDGVEGIRDLQGFGYAEARNALPELKNRFFATKADEFVSGKNAGASPT